MAREEGGLAFSRKTHGDGGGGGGVCVCVCRCANSETEVLHDCFPGAIPACWSAAYREALLLASPA